MVISSLIHVVKKRLKIVLKSLAYESNLYGLDSLRAGGAIAVGSNGISERLIMIHGRWKTHTVKDM